MENIWFFVYIDFFCVGAGISTLISISDGLGSYFFPRKIESTKPMREKMDGRCLFPARVGICVFIVDMIKVLFPICTLT